MARREVLDPPDPLGRQPQVEEGDIRRLPGADRDGFRQHEGDAARGSLGGRGGGGGGGGTARGAIGAQGAARHLRRGGAHFGGGARRRGHHGRGRRRRAAARVGAHLHRTRDAHRQFGTRDGDGFVDRLAEGGRIAGNKGEAHAVPVAAGGVLHHRPALQPGLRAGTRRAHGRDQQPVGGLPQRRARDIEHRDLARAFGPQADLDAPFIGGARGGERLGRAGHAPRERGVGQLHLIPFAQQHGDEAAFRDQRQAQPVGRLGGVGDAPARAAGLGLLAAQRGEQALAAAEILRAQGQAAEGLPRQVARGQAQPLHRAGGVHHDQAAQQVVHILGGGAEDDMAIGRNLPRAFDLREAGGGEGHAAHGQFGPERGRGHQDEGKGQAAHGRSPLRGGGRLGTGAQPVQRRAATGRPAAARRPSAAPSRC